MANIFDQTEEEAAAASRGNPVGSMVTSTRNIFADDPAGPPLASAQPQRPPQSWPEAIYSGAVRTARLANEGAFGGLGARGAAVGRMITDGGTYNDRLREEFAAREAAKQEVGPVASSFIQAGGGLVSGMGLTRAGVGFARNATDGLVRRMAKSGVEGGLQGAVLGASGAYSGNFEDYLKNGLWGLGTGTGIGAAAPAVGAAAKGIYKWGADRWSGIPTQIAKAGRADAQGVAQLHQYGPAAMLVDAGPSMQTAAQGTVLGAGDARTRVTNALNARNQERGGRLQSDINTNYGPTPHEADIRADIDAGRQRINQDYPAARAGVALPPQAAQQVIGDLTHLSRSRNVDLGDVIGDLHMAPGMPSLDPQGLMNARQRLGSMIRATEDAIGTGVNPPLNGRYNLQTYRDAYDAINGALTQHVPAVRPVDARFAANRAELEAFEQGLTMLDKGRGNAVDPAQLRPLLATAPPEVRQRMAQGTHVDLSRRFGTMGGDTKDLNVANSALSAPWPQENSRLLFGPRQADNVRDAIAREVHFADSHNRITGGPGTAEKIAAGGQVGSIPASSGGVVRDMARWTADKFRTAAQEERRNEMARWLAARDPAQVAAMRDRILRHNATVGPRADTIGAYATAGARGGANALVNPVAPVPPPYIDEEQR